MPLHHNDMAKTLTCVWLHKHKNVTRMIRAQCPSTPQPQLDRTTQYNFAMAIFEAWYSGGSVAFGSQSNCGPVSSSRVIHLWLDK